MRIQIGKIPPGKYQGDLLVYFARQEEKEPVLCGGEAAVRETVARARAAGDFKGAEGQTLLYYPEGGGAPGSKRILIVGLGREEASRELLRKAGGHVAKAVRKTKAGELLLRLPVELGPEPGELAECLVEGLILGAYKFAKYKTGAENSDDEEQQVTLQRIALYADRIKGLSAAVKQGRVAAEAACRARDLDHEPANYWTPTHFAEAGRTLAEKGGLRCRVLGKKEMVKAGLGGILAVNQGSAEPPTLTILEYRTGKKVPTLLLVGKGITFDAGGYSLKPSAGMAEMKYDMCGAAAVLAIMEAVAELKPGRLDVVALLPATENLVGPAALKPGDVITHYGGKTVEVMNTDAEGRLILADALAYGIDKYKPDLVVDIATLTGAVIIGLGHHRTGLLATDDRLAARLTEAGERAGEPLWRLPLGPEYARQLRSEIADLKNVHKRDAGTIIAGCFLQAFVGDTPWAHLDIAGTAWNFTEKSYIPKGPSGVGVRTLLEFIRNYG